MRLFDILTVRVDPEKMMVTRTLLHRVRRKMSGESCSKPPTTRRRKHQGFARLCCAALVAALTLPICLVSAHAATVVQPTVNTTATSGYSAAALFNQANADARNGKTGPAILNYERAFLLAPNDADIAANLHFVLAKAGLPDAPENWFARSLTFARPNTLAWLGSFGVMLAGMSLLLVRLQPQRRLAFRSLTIVGALLVATALGSAITTWPMMKAAVVITSETPARISSVSNAEATFKLREGETVTVRAEHQGFALVQTSAGRSGWVARADLARVVPQSGDRSQSTHRT
jgi:tetratricopeptide (TPR) repeat protein